MREEDVDQELHNLVTAIGTLVSLYNRLALFNGYEQLGLPFAITGKKIP